MDFSEYRKLCDGASVGPWEAVEQHFDGSFIIKSDLGLRLYVPQGPNTAKFIAASKQMAPKLLDIAEKYNKLKTHLLSMSFHEPDGEAYHSTMYSFVNNDVVQLLSLLKEE